MYHITIISVGRPKETWIEGGVNEFARRLVSVAQLDTVWVADDAALARALAKEKQVILLDPAGRMIDSIQFAELVVAKLVEGGSHLTFAIGGADGLPRDLDSPKRPRFSLSPLTFTHQLARLVLAEQLYRAFEIQRGSPYHR